MSPIPWIAMLAGSIALAAESEAWVSANVMAPDGAMIPAVSVIARRSDGRIFRLERRDAEPAETRLPAGVYEFTMAPAGGWVSFRRARVSLLPGERVTLPLIAHEVTILCDLNIMPPASPAVQAPVIRYEEWSADGKAVMIAFARKWGNEYAGHPAGCGCHSRSMSATGTPLAPPAKARARPWDR